MTELRSQSIDGLRGLAVTVVVARHLFDVRYGMFGVDLFFVISGFLIGGILIDNRDEPGYFSSFYGRRAFRILPLYWLLLVIMLPNGWPYYMVFAQAIPWLQAGHYPLTEPTFVTWSLAIEEQFYCVLPIMVFALPRPWLIRVLWAGVLMAPVWRLVLSSPDLPGNSWQFLLPGRLDELFGGVLIACFVRGYCKSKLLWAVLACLPALADVLCALTIGAVSMLSIAGLSCSVIVLAAATASRTPVILRPFIWPGRRCYFLYLFHILIFDVFLHFDFEYPGVAALATVCVLAEISWRYLEAPLIDQARRRFERREARAIFARAPAG